MDCASTRDESSEADLHPCHEDFALSLSSAKSLFSLSKRLDELLISYESLHKTCPVQQPVRLPPKVENELSVKQRAEVLDQRAADNGM
jgi:hypothetical protein